MNTNYDGPCVWYQGKQYVPVEELAELRLAVEGLERAIKNWGIVEFSIRNSNVSSYMNEWETRALRAEEILRDRKRGSSQAQD